MNGIMALRGLFVTSEACTWYT